MIENLYCVKINSILVFFTGQSLRLFDSLGSCGGFTKSAGEDHSKRDTGTGHTILLGPTQDRNAPRENAIFIVFDTCYCSRCHSKDSPR